MKDERYEIRIEPNPDEHQPVLSLQSANKLAHFKRLLESRVEETSRVLANTEHEQKASSARHPDEADQAAAEYERQNVSFKAAAASRPSVPCIRHLNACSREPLASALNAVLTLRRNDWKQFLGRDTASNVRKLGSNDDRHHHQTSA